MGRRHFIFLYIEEFEFNVEEIEDEEPLEGRYKITTLIKRVCNLQQLLGKQHQPQPNATTTRKQYYSFDIFKLSEPTNNTQTGIHTAVQHHHHHDQEQNPDYKNCAWRISKISVDDRKKSTEQE
jgi:cupin superfamily acireductone dioxygenase involved in methionine salvage